MENTWWLCISPGLVRALRFLYNYAIFKWGRIIPTDAKELIVTYQPLLESMADLVERMNMLTGVAVAYGNKKDFCTAQIGNIQEIFKEGDVFVPCVRPVREDTVYDLASLTKLFTLISVMQLMECGELSFQDKVGEIEPRFVNLNDVNVRDVLCYEASLQTPQRIDGQADRESAFRQVLLTGVNPVEPARLYSDMNALILKYVVEKVSRMPFFTYIQQNILNPSGMENTFSKIPPDRLKDCACYNYEHRIIKDEFFLRTDAPTGVPHDPKARILSDEGRDLCGHAGLFSTLSDMRKLCQALLSGRLITMDTLREIGINRTGHVGENGSYRQYLGYLCFVKNPVQHFSEVPLWMSDRSFGLSGFTGNHVAIDPDLGVFDLFLGNRCHNRLSIIQPREGLNIAQYGLTADGAGTVDWDDGRKVKSSYLYIHQKDRKLHEPIREHMQLLGWI